MGCASAWGKPSWRRYSTSSKTLKRSSLISRWLASSNPQTSTCTNSASVGKNALTSSPTLKSG